MGGYGGISGRIKEKCYYDTGGFKVKDKNAIEVAEYYINEGKYVAFLRVIKDQKRADLSVEGIHTEVKGMSSMKPSEVANNISEGFDQVYADNYRYPAETHRIGRVVILSKYSTLEDAISVVKAGYEEAVRKKFVRGNVLLLHKGVMYNIN